MIGPVATDPVPTEALRYGAILDSGSERVMVIARITKGGDMTVAILDSDDGDMLPLIAIRYNHHWNLIEEGQ